MPELFIPHSSSLIPEMNLLLSAEMINRKLKRMAYEIWERHSSEKQVTFLGIEHSGTVIAEVLAGELRRISPLEVAVITLTMDKKNPLDAPPALDQNLDGASVVLIDDVANSGKTLFYALGPLMHTALKSLSIAVLVDRKHKRFPITPDIVGHAVATTLEEHIEVVSEGDRVTGAYLQ